MFPPKCGFADIVSLRQRRVNAKFSPSGAVEAGTRGIGSELAHRRENSGAEVDGFSCIELKSSKYKRLNFGKLISERQIQRG
jgi:hypothetical protein